jgi:hypothetical protein
MNVYKRVAKLVNYYQSDFDFAVLIERWFAYYENDNFSEADFNFRKIMIRYSDLSISIDELLHFMRGLKDKNYVYHCSDFCCQVGYCSSFCKNIIIFNFAGIDLIC